MCVLSDIIVPPWYNWKVEMVIRHGLRHAGWAEQWEVAGEIIFSREHMMYIGLGIQPCFCTFFACNAAVPSYQRNSAW